MLFELWLPLPLHSLLIVPSVRLITLGTATLLVATFSWLLLEQPLNRFRGAKTPAAFTVPSGDQEAGVTSMIPNEN